MGGPLGLTPKLVGTSHDFGGLLYGEAGPELTAGITWVEHAVSVF